MKLNQLLLIMILTTSFLASSIVTASAQQGFINTRHCTASNPCQRICGDHVCAPTEAYPLVSNNTKMQNATTTISAVPQVPTGISSIYDANGTRMVSDSKMCLAGVDTCIMVKTLHAPPIKQMNVGIGALDVSCKTDFQLVLKTTNNLPACVSSATANELVKRGWALSQDAMMKEKLMFEPNNQ